MAEVQEIVVLCTNQSFSDLFFMKDRYHINMNSARMPLNCIYFPFCFVLTIQVWRRLPKIYVNMTVTYNNMMKT